MNQKNNECRKRHQGKNKEELPRSTHVLVASLRNAILPLSTAKTEIHLGNFFAQYLATDADERIV